MKNDSLDLVSMVHEITGEVIADQLAEIDTREQAAEKGPWIYGDYGQFVFLSDGGSMVAQMRGWGRLTANPSHLPPEKAAAQQDANGKFLAHSREDIPFLRNLVRELQECNARQVQLLRDAQVGWAADVARLSADLNAAYMRAVKHTIYEIMKDADVHGSQAIRDSGDTADGMCEQAAKLLTDPKQAYNTLRNWCKNSNCVDYCCPLELDGLHCLCHEPQPSMWPELKEGGPADDDPNPLGMVPSPAEKAEAYRDMERRPNGIKKCARMHLEGGDRDGQIDDYVRRSP